MAISILWDLAKMSPIFVLYFMNSKLAFTSLIEVEYQIHITSPDTAIIRAKNIKRVATPLAHLKV